MNFFYKHLLSISVVLFTVLFFLAFLYIDLTGVMFLATKEGLNVILGLFKRAWFLLIPDLLLIPLMIYLLVLYIKSEKSFKKWIIIPSVIVFELLYTFVVSMYFMAPGFSFYPCDYNSMVLSYNNVSQVSVTYKNQRYSSTYYDNGFDKVSIMFLGNSMVSSDVFEFIGEENLELSERNLLVMDYPYFSSNPGRLTEKTIYDLVDLNMDMLLNEYGYSFKDIRVIGYSIGTGVACYCAEKYDVSELVLFAPYYKFQDAMNRVTPVFYGPLELCVRFKFESYKRAPNIKCMTTIIYSDSDKVITESSTQALISCFNNKEVVKYHDYTHTMVFRNDDTINYLLH